MFTHVKPPVGDLVHLLSQSRYVHVSPGSDSWSLVVGNDEGPGVTVALVGSWWLLFDDPARLTGTHLCPRGMEEVCAVYVARHLRTRRRAGLRPCVRARLVPGEIDLIDKPPLPPAPPEICGRPGCGEVVTDKWAGCPKCDQNK